MSGDCYGVLGDASICANHPGGKMASAGVCTAKYENASLERTKATFPDGHDALSYLRMVTAEYGDPIRHGHLTAVCDEISRLRAIENRALHYAAGTDFQLVGLAHYIATGECKTWTNDKP